MRTYKPTYEKYGISRERYNELRAFCRQYPEWKSEASSLLGVGAQQYSDMPHGSDVGDPVARAAMKRLYLMEKIAMVERVAGQVDGGRWYAALIQHCCMGRPLRFIDATVLPTTRRNEFYLNRRLFYIALDAAKEEFEREKG
jgi:hypothetical protein